MTLEEKLALRSGRIQLIVAAVSRLAYGAAVDDKKLIQEAQWELLDLAVSYEQRWLDETADLLKNQYNRLSDAV